MITGNHREPAFALCDLGMVYVEQGQIEEGLGYIERAREMRSRVLGERTYEYIQTLLYVAKAHLAAGREDLAENLFRDIQIRHHQLGTPQHPSVGLALLGLGTIAEQRNASDAALQYFEQALAIGATFPQRNWLTIAKAWDKIGDIHHHTGQNAARQAYEQSLKAYQHAVSLNHPFIMRVKNKLVRL